MVYNFKKILIIHTAGIGDLIAFTPVLRILRNNFPKATVDVFVLYTPESRHVLQEGETVNRIFEFAWTKNSFFNKLKFLYRLRKEKYDLSTTPTDLHPLKGKILSFFIGAKVRVGEERKNKSKNGLFYTHTSLLRQDIKRTESDMDLLRAIGLRIDYPLPAPFIEVSSKDEEFADNFLIKNSLNNKILIGFHPGSGENQKFKRWPQKYFIELSRKILYNFPNAVILIFGGRGEEELCLGIKNELDKNAMVISGYSLKQVAVLMNKCKVFVSSDSGLNHLASTTKTNLVSIFGPTDPKRGAPIDREDVYILKENCEHSYNLDTYKNYDRERVHSCLEKITPDRVFGKIKEVLSKF
ncbi:glycosyltransferase family 9 protein [Patescibacteria group bacterium]|nr:glycosyltransferase family 9 protein [Patescibacteria group bacterium]